MRSKLAVLKAVLVVCVVVAAGGDAHAIELVSGNRPERYASSGSLASTSTGLVSADGRFVVIRSLATNLMWPGTNWPNLYLWDREEQSLTLISHKAGQPFAELGGSYIEAFAISADGDYVLFKSSSTAVVDGVTDSNGVPDLFLYERSSNSSRLVTHIPGSPLVAAPSGGGLSAALSADGRFAAFVSSQPLMQGMTGNGASHVFLFDRETGENRLVSFKAGSPAVAAGSERETVVAISSDGSRVVYLSQAGDLVAGFVRNETEVNAFVFDRTTGTNMLVSHTPGAPLQAVGAGHVSTDPAVTRVAFATQVEMEPGYYGGLVFAHDVSTGGVTLVSHTVGSPAAYANEGAWLAVVSRDGSAVYFESGATDHVSGVIDENGVADVFRWDAVSGNIELITRSASNAAATANGASQPRGVDATGRVLITSTASDLISNDTNGQWDALLCDVKDGCVPLSPMRDGVTIPHASDSEHLHISSDSRFFTFATHGAVVDGDANGTYDVYQLDRLIRNFTLVSARHPDVPSSTHTRAGWNRSAAISGDGSRTVYSDGSVWMHDRRTGERTIISVRENGRAATGYNAVISRDGLTAAFVSRELLLAQAPGVIGDPANVYVRNLVTGETTLVTRAFGTGSRSGDGDALESLSNGEPTLSISEDGRYLAFISTARNLVENQSGTSRTPTAFLFDRLSTSIVTISPDASRPVYSISIAASGRAVLYKSSLGDFAGVATWYRWDRTTGSTIAIGPDMRMTHPLNGPGAVISSDGTRVAYEGRTLLTTNEVFLRDFAEGWTRMVSHSAAGSSQQTGMWARLLTMSGDGRSVLFLSEAADVVAGVHDTTGADMDVYRYDISSGANSLVSSQPGQPLLTAESGIVEAATDESGGIIVLATTARNLVAPPLPHIPCSTSSVNMFLIDTASGKREHLSRSGVPGVAAPTCGSSAPGVSANGWNVSFLSSSATIVMNDRNNLTDLFTWFGPRPRALRR